MAYMPQPTRMTDSVCKYKGYNQSQKQFSPPYKVVQRADICQIKPDYSGFTTLNSYIKGVYGFISAIGMQLDDDDGI